MKCKCFGCSNESHQGRFVGEFCAPCYSYITTGKVGPTDSFLELLWRQSPELDQVADWLQEAAQDVSEWGSYASDYFQNKHDLEGCVSDLQIKARYVNELAKQFKGVTKC